MKVAPRNSQSYLHRQKSHLKPISESSHPSPSLQDSPKVTSTILTPKWLAVKDGLQFQAKNRNWKQNGKKKRKRKTNPKTQCEKERKRRKKKKKGKKRTQAQNFAVVFTGLSCGCHGLDEVGAWLVWLGKGDEVWRGMLDLGMEKSFCGLGFWCEGKSCWWGRKGELDLTRHWQWVHACVFNYENANEN